MTDRPVTVAVKGKVVVIRWERAPYGKGFIADVGGGKDRLYVTRTTKGARTFRASINGVEQLIGDNADQAMSMVARAYLMQIETGNVPRRR